MRRSDPLVDFKALATGILEKDRTIRERVPGHVDSLEAVADCGDDKCPSCGFPRSQRQDAMTLRHFFIRDSIRSFTGADWHVARTSYPGKDAHSLIPQSVMRAKTREILKKHFGAEASPCDLENGEKLGPFEADFRKTMQEVCTQPADASVIASRVGKLRDWVNSKAVVDHFRLEEKIQQFQAQTHADVAIYRDDLPASWKRLAAGVPGVYTEEAAEALLAKKETKLSVNGAPLATPVKGGPVTADRFQDNALLVDVNGKTVRYQLAEGNRPVPPGTEGLTSEQRKVYEKFRGESPRIFDGIQVERHDDGSVSLHKKKYDEEKNIALVYTRKMDADAKTLAYDVRGYKKEDGSVKELYSRSLLGGGGAKKSAHWPDQIFENIMGKPFTGGTQCSYCEEVQADETLWQRYAFYQSHRDSTPIAYVGREMLAKLDAEGPEKVFHDYMTGVINELKARAAADCAKQREAAQKAAAASPAAAPAAAALPAASAEEVDLAYNAALQTSRDTEGGIPVKTRAAITRLNELLAGKAFPKEKIKELSEAIRSANKPTDTKKD
ncbi:MAG: hypothetical protein IT165_23210 [Bryobacterales bacterium]|nr:hypothetical protein [Bryobacterales bacterium]